MNISKYACELMHLIGKNRLLKPQDMDPKDTKDIQTLITALRMTPLDYPHF